MKKEIKSQFNETAIKLIIIFLLIALAIGFFVIKSKDFKEILGI